MNIEKDIVKDNEKSILNDIYKIYLQEVINIPLLSKEEEQRLFLENTKEAREKIIMANLRFVIMIAKKYERKNISIMDLIQEGNLGLQYAVENFDVTKNVRFLTYAYYYIRKKIAEYVLEKGRVIRLPREIQEDIYRFKKEAINLQHELGRLPSLNEIADRMDLSLKQVKRIFFLLEDVKSMNNIVRNSDSRKRKDGQEMSIFLSSDDVVEEQAIEKEFIKLFYSLLEKSKLTNKEMDIIIKRYGLYNSEKQTLDKIARDKNVSHQAIFCLEKRAIEKLHNSKILVYLSDYVDKPKVKIKD